tara:strand:+ start:1560 stop:6986 length:5427 start_codon:yes stop_codon:yes gene_type:complete
MSPDDKRKADAWWSRQIEKYPHLIRMYGQQVPIDNTGKVPSSVLSDVKTARSASQPLVGTGPLLPTQERLLPPEPVNWAEAARNITSGIGNLATLPASIVDPLLPTDTQQGMESAISKTFGQEPRDFTVPEDAGFWRQFLDPVLPTLGGVETAYERFGDPLKASALVGYGQFTDTDPFGVVSRTQALQDAGFGPLESRQAGFEQSDVPWYVDLPLEILTSPEELLPVVGLYGGLTRGLTRPLTKAVAKAVPTSPVASTAEAVEEVVPTRPIKPVYERGTGAEETIMGRAKQQRVSEPEIDYIQRATPISEPTEIVDAITKTPVEASINKIKNIFKQEVPTRIEEETIPATGVPADPFLPSVIDDLVEQLGTITESGKQKYTIIRQLEDVLGKSSSINNDVVDGIDDLRSTISEYRNTTGAGSRTRKNELFEEAKSIVEDLTPVPRAVPEPQQMQFGMQVGEAIESVPTYRQNVVRDIVNELEQNASLFTDDIIAGSTDLRNAVDRYVQGTGLDASPESRELAEQLFGGTGFRPEQVFNDIENAANALIAKPIDALPTGAQRTAHRPTEAIMGSGRGTAEVAKALELTPNEDLSKAYGRSHEVESQISLAKSDGNPVTSSIQPTTQTTATYKSELISSTKTLEEAIRDMIPADIWQKAVFKPAQWLNDKLGEQLITKYEGTLNSHLAKVQDFNIKGAKMMEELGLGERVRGLTFGTERYFQVSEEAWGTLNNPGPLRVLYRALHNEGDGVNQWISGVDSSGIQFTHPAMAANKTRQRQDMFNTLREITDYEESMRIDFDPNIGRIKDYFYRGWKLPEDAAGNSIPPNMSRIGQRPSYLKGRTAATYMEMEEAGFEPMFRNPFEQSAYSQQQGIKYRLQSELVDWLQSDKVGLAHHVEGKMGIDELNTKFAASGVKFRVPEVGPAFEGKGYEIIEASGKREEFDVGVIAGSSVGDPSRKIVIKAGQIAVPEKVADTLESIFRGGATSWEKTIRVTIPTTNKVVPINLVKVLDALVFIPKRIKLFASLFQATDFMRRIGVGGTHGALDAVWEGLARGLSPKESFEAGRVTGEVSQSFRSIGQGWWDVISSYGAAGKTDYYRNLLRSTKTTGAEAVAEGTSMTWDGLVRNGLNVRDLTILPGEDIARMVDSVASNAGFPKKMLRHIKELEYSSRRGLFDRVYPAAIMTDVKFNLIPIARRAYPNATDEQIMALVAKQANLKYSTLLRSQSAVRSGFREILTRLMFSLNENESLIRQVTGSVAGTQTGFWRKYWVSAALFFAVTSNVIHGSTTLVTDGEFKPLPKERYIPWREKNKGWWKFGYNNRLFSPDIPIRSRSGELASIDMLGQLDMAGRMFDFNHVPLDTFVFSRLGATAGAFVHLIQGKDFYGRETDKFGWSGKLLQFAYDVGVPIGMGEAGVGLVREAVGDKELPSMGKFIAPGATVKDILPVAEPALGVLGQLVEATGENIKAPTGRQLQKQMIQNYDPSLEANNFSELDTNIRFQVENAEVNKGLKAELKQRSIEGAALDNVWDEQRVERDKAKADRLQAEMDYETELDNDSKEGRSYDAGKFRERVKMISITHSTQQDMIGRKYLEDLDIKLSKKAYEEKTPEDLEKDRLEFPVRWAEYKYNQILSKHLEAYKTPDYDKLKEEIAAEQDTWGEELVIQFNAHRSANSEQQHSERIQRYYNGMDLLNKIGYFQSQQVEEFAIQQSKRLGTYEGKTLLDVWREWEKGGSPERTRIEKTSPFRGSIKMLKQQRDQARKAIVRSPEHGLQVDRIRIEFFGSNPVYRENIGLFEDLYKRRPSRLSPR